MTQGHSTVFFPLEMYLQAWLAGVRAPCWPAWQYDRWWLWWSWQILVSNLASHDSASHSLSLLYGSAIRVRQTCFQTPDLPPSAPQRLSPQRGGSEPTGTEGNMLQAMSQGPMAVSSEASPKQLFMHRQGTLKWLQSVTKQQPTKSRLKYIEDIP